jgi:hypothetical protein
MRISLRSPISSVVVVLALCAASAMTGCDRSDDQAIYKTVTPKSSVATATAQSGKPIRARSYQIGRAPEGIDTAAGKPTEGPALPIVSGTAAAASHARGGAVLSAEEREDRADDRADQVEEAAEHRADRMEDRADRVEEASERR